MENSVIPEQMTSGEAIWSGSTLFLKRVYPGSAKQGECFTVGIRLAQKLKSDFHTTQLCYDITLC